MDNTPTDPEFSTEAQSRELDRMSAELIRKLNDMIAEQEARVSEFATQHPNASLIMPDMPHEMPAAIQHTQAASAPRKPQRHVTPPPAQKQASVPREAAVPPPMPSPGSANRGQRMPKKETDKKEEGNTIGCGSVVVVLAVIFLLLRSCS